MNIGIAAGATSLTQSIAVDASVILSVCIRNKRRQAVMKLTIDLLDHSIVVTNENSGAWEETAMGISCLTRQECCINSALEGDALSCTILHELIHIIEEINSMQLSEQDVSNIAVGFLSLIKRNPELIKQIQEASDEHKVP